MSATRPITYAECLSMYSSCFSPIECFYLFRITNSDTWSDTELADLARACVYSMYRTHLFTANCIKTMLLFSGHPPSRSKGSCHIKVWHTLHPSMF